MAEVGTYYITVMPEMSKFTSGVNSALGNLGTDSGKKFSTSFGQILAGSALGTALGSFATQVGSAIMGGLSTGIARLDTIENFPRVMESLGYTSNEAADSIQLIMQHLDGLPTATQDMVTLTQALSDSTGDLDLATRAALGFNDMMLANGASSAEMASAQGVLNRVIGKGSATVAQWQSLMAVMPAQLGMVAREMLGAEATSEDLHAALEDGTVGWNDFLRAVVKLDEEGSESLASFEEQARANSHGIGTAINNVKNRIGAGWASILDSIGRENISSAIDRASYGIRDAMNKVADAFKWLKYTILGTNIDESVGKIFDNIKGFISGIDLSGLRDFARALIELVDGAFSWIADNGETVGLVLSMIGGALAVVVGVQLGQWLVVAGGALTVFVAGLGGLAGIIQFSLLGAIGALVGGLVWFFTETEAGQAIVEGFVEGCKRLWEDLKQSWENTVNTIKENIEANALVWENFKTNLAQWNEEMRAAIAEKWQAIKDAIKGYVEDAKNNVTQNWQRWASDIAKWNDDIRQKALDKWRAIKDGIKGYVDEAKQGVVSRWQQWASDLAQWNENIRQRAMEKWQAISDGIKTRVDNIRQGVSSRWQAMKDAIAQWNEGIRQSAYDKWQAIGNSIANIVGNIRDNISSRFQSARDTALGVFDSIRNGIRDRLQDAYNTVSGIISNIRGLFNFSWSLPRPSLPHISWHMESVAGLLSIPVFDGISWWAQGGIFDKASIIGVGEGRDSEAVLPLNDKTYGAIARGIAGELGGGGGVVVTGNTFIVRNDRDIEAIGVAINQRAERERRSLL